MFFTECKLHKSRHWAFAAASTTTTATNDSSSAEIKFKTKTLHILIHWNQVGNLIFRLDKQWNEWMNERNYYGVHTLCKCYCLCGSWNSEYKLCVWVCANALRRLSKAPEIVNCSVSVWFYACADSLSLFRIFFLFDVQNLQCLFTLAVLFCDILVIKMPKLSHIKFNTFASGIDFKCNRVFEFHMPQWSSSCEVQRNRCHTHTTLPFDSVRFLLVIIIVVVCYFYYFNSNIFLWKKKTWTWTFKSEFDWDCIAESTEKNGQRKRW